MRLARVLSAVALALGIMLGPTTPAQAANGPWMQVSAGAYHTCALSSVKSLYCWGNNAFGPVGNGASLGNQPTPFRVGAVGVWASVAAGDTHTCGITTAKNLYCWGNNGQGQIGTGTAGGVHRPLYRVGGAGVWASVAAGGNHTCGITTAKNLYCWGNNEYGQIGTGTVSSNQLALYRVGGAGVWASASAGFFHTCGITVAKNLYCWGNNGSAQTGNGIYSTNQLALYRVGGAGVWANVEAGLYHTCGITAAKNLYCWGYNGFGQIGNGIDGGGQLTLYRVGGIGVWASTSAGSNHTCGITTGKNLYCWGYNGFGQIGTGIAGGNQLPLYRVGGIGVWASTSAGTNHTCGITTGKNLYCWGNNDHGQIGTGIAGGNQLPLYRVL